MDAKEIVQLLRLDELLVESKKIAPGTGTTSSGVSVWTWPKVA